MASLKQQLSQLADQVERWRDAIPVEARTVGVTIEQHSPGNGSIYTRLRVPKGKALANGKRTMSLKAEDVEVWQQKIYARNQHYISRLEGLAAFMASVETKKKGMISPPHRLVRSPQPLYSLVDGAAGAICTYNSRQRQQLRRQFLHRTDNRFTTAGTILIRESKGKLECSRRSDL